MNIITENAENILINNLKAFKKEEKRSFCLDIKTKDLSSNKILKIFETVFKEYKATSYMCFETIFIIISNVSNKDFLNIKKETLDIFNNEYFTDLDIFSIFDLEKDWSKIKNLINNKIIDKEILKILESHKTENLETKSLDTDKLDILVVEDDIFTGQLIRRAIEDKGINIFLAKNGKEAIELYIKESPYIVFLDIELPDINGYDILEKMKKINDNLFAIILSSHDSEENIAEAFEMKAKGFISKPFPKHKLIKQIELAREEFLKKLIA